MLYARAGQCVLKIVHSEMWAVIEQRTVNYIVGIHQVQQKYICDHLGRVGHQWNGSDELGEPVSDSQNVLVTGIGPRLGPEIVNRNKRKEINGKGET